MRSRFGIVAIATAALVAAIAGTSCNKEEQKTGFKEKTAVSWTPSDESYTIRVGETAKVEGTLLYDDGQTVTLEAFCTSDNPEVVRADGGLGVLGIAPGTATVNAQVRLYRNGNLSARPTVFEKPVTFTVKAEDKQMMSLEVSPSELTLERGESVRLKVFAVYPDGGRKEIAPSLCRWSVEDDGVQHVIYGSDGVVTACQYSGWTVITASYTESGQTVSASSCITTVD